MKRKWGMAIQQQRKYKRMSQIALASALGVKQSTVSKWESGDIAPSPDRQLAIARVLEIDARLLFAYPEAA